MRQDMKGEEEVQHERREGESVKRDQGGRGVDEHRRITGIEAGIQVSRGTSGGLVVGNVFTIGFPRTGL